MRRSCIRDCASKARRFVLGRSSTRPISYTGLSLLLFIIARRLHVHSLIPSQIPRRSAREDHWMHRRRPPQDLYPQSQWDIYDSAHAEDHIDTNGRSTRGPRSRRRSERCRPTRIGTKFLSMAAESHSLGKLKFILQRQDYRRSCVIQSSTHCLISSSCNVLNDTWSG